MNLQTHVCACDMPNPAD